MKRYALVLVLFVAVAGVSSRWVRSAPITSPMVVEPNPEVPASVRAAAAEGRYWLASRLMDRHLSTVSDTTSATILYTARLEGWWGDWSGVAELLEGRAWLDELEAGAGWELLGRARMALGEPAGGAEALARYLASGRLPDRDAGMAEVRRGIALDRAGETELAVTAFDRAGRLIPWLRDWTSLYAAETAAAAGDTATVRVQLADAGAVAADRAWRVRLRAARAAGDSMAARTVAMDAARSAPTISARASAWTELGALRLAAGDTARARAAFVEAMATAGSTAAVDAARALTDLAPSPTEWRRIADIYARHGNARRAAEGYAAYLNAGVGSAAERFDARLQLGRARFNSGSYDQAEKGLLELAAEPVPPAIGAEALYLVGRAQYRQGRSQDGQRTLARLPERFPGQDAVTQGLYLLADLKHDDLQLDDARRYYRQAAEVAPALNEAGLALMRLGGLAMLDRDHEEAVAIFEEYRRLHPDGRRWGQSTYWAARAYRELGREGEALARLRELWEKDPISYYGVRAAESLDVPVLSVPMAQAPSPDSGADVMVREGIRRVDALAELDRRDDLVQEVERLRKELAGHVAAEYALAEALTERAHTLTAIGMGWDLFRRTGQWNPRLLRIVYPFPFREIITAEARDRELDPYLVAGLIRRESAFNPTVTSGAGAMGLMQVMPETGRTLAREVGLRSFDTRLLMQPEINVHLGTLYLATMLERFHHDLPLVLSAYNAGPTRAARWRDLPEARDPDLFTERVPYGETRDYIRHVSMHRALYEALYPGLGGPDS